MSRWGERQGRRVRSRGVGDGSREVCQAGAAEEIRRGAGHGVVVRGFDLGCGVDALDSEGELIAAGDRLGDDILLSDARGEEGFAGAGDERVDYGGVPAGVNDGDAEGGAWMKVD